jgi:muconolactone delta-isomerase
MDAQLIQFMVDFTMPANLTDEFVNRIPHQRAAVNRLLGEGKLINYALSLEDSKLWAVFSVHSEVELMELVSSLPLTPFMSMRISELTFYNAAHPFSPAFSMN